MYRSRSKTNTSASATTVWFTRRFKLIVEIWRPNTQKSSLLWTSFYRQRHIATIARGIFSTPGKFSEYPTWWKTSAFVSDWAPSSLRRIELSRKFDGFTLEIPAVTKFLTTVDAILVRCSFTTQFRTPVADFVANFQHFPVNQRNFVTIICYTESKQIILPLDVWMSRNTCCHYSQN